VTQAHLCKVMQESHGLLRDALPAEIRNHGAVLAGVLAVQAVQARLVQQQIPQVPASTRSASAGAQAYQHNTFTCFTLCRAAWRMRRR